MATPSTVYDPLWYPDSGASHHLTPDLSQFSSKSTYNGEDLVQVGNGAGMRIKHVGTSSLLCHNSHSSFSLNNLLHVPGLTKNLLSVSQFCKDNGVYFEFYSDSCCVKSQVTKETILQGILRGGLYVFPDLHSTSTEPIPLNNSLNNSVCSIDVSPSSFIASCLNNSSINFGLWHARLGHPSSRIVHCVLNLCKIPADMNKISFV